MRGETRRGEMEGPGEEEEGRLADGPSDDDEGVLAGSREDEEEGGELSG